MPGLSVGDVIRLNINLLPTGVPTRNFGAVLVLGYSDVIDVYERYRPYTTLSQIAADYGTTAPEYIAGQKFYSQNPQPSLIYLGRWAKTASKGILHGGVFSAAQQATLITTLQAINSGGMTVSIDSTPHALTALDFTSITTLNGAATIIGVALPSATVTFDSVYGRFNIESNTTGTSSIVSYATTPGSGTDVSATFKLTAATFASVPVDGIAAETPLVATTILANQTNDWYGLAFAVAADTDISDAQYEAVGAFIEGASPSRLFGITADASTIIDPTQTGDLASVLADLAYSRTFIQYSSSSLAAAISLLGRIATVNFLGSNTTLTAKFKTEPGIVAESLTEAQAAAVKAKNCNVFVNYENGAAIIQEGVMCDGTFIDTRHGADWLQNYAQTNLWNYIAGSPTKIPQTDAGIDGMVANLAQSFNQAINNGLGAPGIWNSNLEFGQLKSGQALTAGYYIFAQPVALQPENNRALREAPPIQCAFKLGGAVHSADVTVNINA